MDKPLTLQIEEFRNTMINTINNSNMHLYIVDTVLKDLYSEVHLMYQNQTAKEIKEYQDSVDNPNQPEEENNGVE